MKLTLPTDSAKRKRYPLRKGVFNYFPAALAGVAQVSIDGNDKHNPGQPLHHARGKSADHADCVDRHLTDLEDLLAAIQREETDARLSHLDPRVLALLTEASQLAWRALALSQELHEKYDGAPLAPAAVEPDACRSPVPPEDLPGKIVPWQRGTQNIAYLSQVSAEVQVGDKPRNYGTKYNDQF